ncbi:MAG: hypothetical protein MZV70_05075 [Desulfobacterales bacterium]|nr:hypothetical protein [Desulfobacterales bacterium]
MLDEMKKESGGQPRLHPLRRRGARQGAGALRHRGQGALGHGLFHGHLHPGPLPADRRALARGLGRRQGPGRRHRQRRLRPRPQGRVQGGEGPRAQRLHPVLHLDQEARRQDGGAEGEGAVDSVCSRLFNLSNT